MAGEDEVSVIVRAYNTSSYILQSLRSVMNNGYEGTVEIVVCYDIGSKDDTLAKVKRFESDLDLKRKNVLLRIVEHEHMTPFRALLECGFRYSSGKFISILDADNLYPRKRISILVNEWKQTGASFIFTPVVVFEDGTLKVLKKIEAPENPCERSNLIRGNYIDANAMFIHRECLDKVAPMLSRLEARIYDWIHEDWLLALLALGYCRCSYTNKTYSLYRVHRSNLTGCVKPREPSKNVFTTMRNILTLMAFYELERNTLSLRELNSLYFTLAGRFAGLGFWLSRHLISAGKQVNQ